LDQVENEYSQVLPQSLENYHLSGPDIAMLFRKYETHLFLQGIF
jgi:hypothetical protein